MKKVLLLGVCVFMLCGCSSATEYDCTVEGKSAKIAIKDGMVSSYSVDGNKVSQNEIDEINGEYFTGVASNNDAKTAINNFMNSIGGSCNMSE